MLSPIQKFRWVHFPRNADLNGEFRYRVTPVFMNAQDELSYGEAQEAAIELRRETYPGQLNVTFTRGFVSSQAFVDRYDKSGPISTLLPAKANKGLDFTPTHPKAEEALAWMGFEAREAILDPRPGHRRQEGPGPRRRLRPERARSGRTAGEDRQPPEGHHRRQRGSRQSRLSRNASRRAARHFGRRANVKRQHMLSLQHNKTIVVDGPTVKKVVCGSTNFSWRGFFVQNNNAMVLMGASAVKPFRDAFDEPIGRNENAFGHTASAEVDDLGLHGIDASVAFSPHAKANALLKTVADDIGDKTTSCLFYSLAFLYQTPGVIQDAIKKVTKDDKIFVYGISDRKVGGLDLQKPDGNVAPVFAAALTKERAAAVSTREPQPAAAASACTTSSS